ncbi:MAG: fibronectin type III domain-containing protein [Dehalococcoidia bacterium]|nr:fibronectin type III domain-containing protein [Dehalococcoidia bacterium]
MLTPPATQRMCDAHGCANPRRYEITGLTGGQLYEVEVRARNANGWGKWFRRIGRPND